MRRRGVAGMVLAGALCLSGCGGPMQPEELARSIQTLESSATEGALLADDVARDRTKTRTHSSGSDSAG